MDTYHVGANWRGAQFVSSFSLYIFIARVKIIKNLSLNTRHLSSCCSIESLRVETYIALNKEFSKLDRSYC
jgi:hypothetical protein